MIEVNLYTGRYTNSARLIIYRFFLDEIHSYRMQLEQDNKEFSISVEFKDYIVDYQTGKQNKKDYYWIKWSEVNWIELKLCKCVCLAQVFLSGEVRKEIPAICDGI